jgi:NitT/TauT family transport system substrate-binding protein
MKRRILAVILSALMLIAMAACGGNEQPAANVSGTDTAAQRTPINVFALKGPTGISFAELAVNAKTATTGNDYSVSFVASPDEMVGKIANGEADIACVPTNLAASLYKKTNGDIKVCAVTTLGVMYLIDLDGNTKSISDLEGKKVYATAPGSNPEYILDYILKNNQVNADVEFKSEHAELATLMIAGDARIGMLPEPFVTQVMAKAPATASVIDMQAEWEKLPNSAQIASGVIIVKNDFIENNKEAFDLFMNDFVQSTEFALSNVDKTADYCVELEIIGAKPVAVSAIPRCNIVALTGDDMKNAVSGFLGVLFEANPQSIGGTLPDDNFYYFAD